MTLRFWECFKCEVLSIKLGEDLTCLRFLSSARWWRKVFYNYFCFANTKSGMAYLQFTHISVHFGYQISCTSRGLNLLIAKRLESEIFVFRSKGIIEANPYILYLRSCGLCMSHLGNGKPKFFKYFLTLCHSKCFFSQILAIAFCLLRKILSDAFETWCITRKAQT